jgi:heat shock protein HtpX
MAGSDLGTFRERIARNRRNSLLLIAAFLAFIAVFGYVIGYAWLGNPLRALAGLAFALVIGVIAGLISYYGGDRMVLAASRAREITHDDAPVLFNVVEEMSIAAGIPMPKVYIVDDTAPNAFATGRSPEHATVAVTSGLLEKLDRDELQGVMAHEMSHVANFDIRYSMLVGILVGTTVLISDFFLRGLWFGGGRGGGRRGGGDNGGGQLQLIMMLVAIVLAILAPLFARLLQLSISRQREFLADATAVRLTRNPKGLADALQKISGDNEVLEVANRATAHLYIVNPIKKFEKRSKGLFSTHPPIEERIQILRAIEAGGVAETTGQTSTETP